jgi:hypothetical protein
MGKIVELEILAQQGSFLGTGRSRDSRIPRRRLADGATQKVSDLAAIGIS